MQKRRISHASAVKLTEYKASAGSPKTTVNDFEMPFSKVKEVNKSNKRKAENSQAKTARLIYNREASIDKIVGGFDEADGVKGRELKNRLQRRFTDDQQVTKARMLKDLL